MKKYTNMLLVLLILFIFSITCVSATDIQTEDTNNIETVENNEITSYELNKITKTDNTNIKQESQPITVTKDNYNQYFKTNSSGNIHTTDMVKSGDIINLQGTFNDMEFNADKENMIITSIGKTAKLLNCTVYVDGENNRGVKINNLNITNTKDNCEAIILQKSVNTIISDNTVLASGVNGFVITTHSVSNCTIENNYFESTHTQTNMRIYSSDNNKIINNTVIGYANGIYLCAYDNENSNNNLIKYNTVIGKSEYPTCYTIQLMGYGNIVEENTVSGGYRGISSPNSNIIRNNDVDANHTGIYIGEASIVENNNIHVSKDSTGIAVYGDNTIIKNNIISTNNTAIAINNNNITISNNKIISTKYSIYSKANRQTFHEITIENNNITGQIYNTGSMNLTENKIHDTTASNGAAIYNTGTIQLNNNTLHSNNANSKGGAIYNTGKSILTNNLIMQNNATSAGIIYNKGEINATDNTFINNYPISFENNNNQIETVDEGNFIPNNAQVTIYENNTLTKETTIRNKIINYTLNDNIESYSLIINTNNFKNNNFTYTTDNITIKKDLIITINPINPVKYGNNVTITGKFMNANGTVRANSALKIYINGKSVSTRTDNNGRFTVNGKVGVIGTNNVTASHPGDIYYNPTSTSTTFTMTKQDLIITIDPIKTIQYGNNITITGRFTDGDGNIRANNNIKVNINGKSGSVTTDENGYYNFTSIIGKLGVNNVTISHSGGANYNPTNTTATYTVTKQDLQITLEPIGTVTYGAVTIKGKLTDGLGNPRVNTGVKLLINGKSATAKTDKNGKFTFTTKVGKIGINNVTARHNGGGNYNPTSTNITFVMKKQDLKVTIDPINTVTYGNNVVITGTFTDANDKVRANTNIKVIINGKTLTTRTDSNGKFRATSKVGNVGVNNVTVAHSGGTGFNPTSTTTTFTMIKQDLKITINPISTVKKGSTVTVTGTFTDANGKIRANTNLKVNLNGVEYTTRTDTKGAFTFKATANKVGSNTITIAHAGGANYNPTNTTKTFTVTN